MATVYNLYRPHRFSAAFLAISARRSGVIFSARAFPAPLAHRYGSRVFAGGFRSVVIFLFLARGDPANFYGIRYNVGRALFAFRAFRHP